jgi:hypothetical protein
MRHSLKQGRQRFTKLLLTQPPGETMTELLLKYQHQDWMLKEQHQNYQEWNFIVFLFFSSFFLLFLSKCMSWSLLLSTPSLAVDFFGYLFLSFSSFSFFHGFITFTIIN